ncbi:hypothetical protein ACWGH8_11660 [Nonomuraea muscovyensis]|uniref:SAF domain-containing protein n=1 Tax=Nonomuraea muscovyensis TaxID=1124761 RepID=A0A7X0C9A4_9ACTN|nr:hypothetical protein [Nonomuraea muscovyensis]MBB6350677.1 hypothetical protein [Nonomuraea muscovyensis]
MRTSEKPVVNAAGLSGPASRKLPVPPRERKPALAALAVLLILGGALATTLLVMRSGDRISAVRVTQQIGAGQQFTEQAIEEVQIADTGIDYVNWSQRQQVLKSFAAVTILPGTLLTNNMGVKASAELGPGKAKVGLALKPGQAPAGLQKGDRVQVVHVPARTSQAESRVLAQSALVFSVGEAGRTGGNGLITVIVDSSVSPEVLRYASSGEIAVAELPGAR